MTAAGCEPWQSSGCARGDGSCRDPAPPAAADRAARELLRRLIAETARCLRGLDAPQFNLGVAARLKASGNPTIQYVSPRVWAWRGGRVRTIGRAVDLGTLPAAVRNAVLRGARGECGVRGASPGRPDPNGERRGRGALRPRCAHCRIRARRARQPGIGGGTSGPALCGDHRLARPASARVSYSWPRWPIPVHGRPSGAALARNAPGVQ